MIDTLHLDFGDRFKVPYPNPVWCSLVVSRDTPVDPSGTPPRKTELWRTEYGRVEGRRAYRRRTPNFPCDIDIHGWRDHRTHLLVKFSVPELLHGDNWRSVDLASLRQCLEKLVWMLPGIGVELDCGIEEARIVRIDLFKNIEIQQPFVLYKHVLGLIDVRGADRREYNTTFGWHHRGKLWGITIYDKVGQTLAAQEKKGKAILSKESLDAMAKGNILRAELKLRKRKVVQDLLEFDSIGGLFRNWNKLESTYVDFLSRHVFSYVPELPSTENRASLEALLAAFSADNDEKWLHGMLESYGIYELVKRYGKDFFVDSIMTKSGLDGSSYRSKRSRLMRKVKNIELRIDLKNGRSPDGVRFEDLYEELYSKLLLPSLGKTSRGSPTLGSSAYDRN